MLGITRGLSVCPNKALATQFVHVDGMCVSLISHRRVSSAYREFIATLALNTAF